MRKLQDFIVPKGGIVVWSQKLLLCCLLSVFFLAQRTHLARSVALQLKHVHGVVDPPTVVIELDVPRQALDTHLDVTALGILESISRQKCFQSQARPIPKNYILLQQMLTCTAGYGLCALIWLTHKTGLRDVQLYAMNPHKCCMLRQHVTEWLANGLTSLWNTSLAYLMAKADVCDEC